VGYLEIKNLTKKFGDFTAVEDINLTVEKGEMVALLGASGCGKTTILRMIAGFLEPNSGTITINGKVVNRTPPHKRNVGILFQNYALFPHMTVFNNVAFSLKLKKLGKKEIRQRVAEILKLVELEEKEDRYPRQLSGGQQQRVALARALVMEPEVLLLDEPLSNLDAKLRHDMQEKSAFQKGLGDATIIVTHDRGGRRALPTGRLHERRKISPKGGDRGFNHLRALCPRFYGIFQFYEGTVAEVSGGELQVDVGGGYLLSLANAGVPQPCCKGDRIEMTIRPEKVLISRTKQEGYHKGTILNSTYKGLDTLLDIQTDFGAEIHANITENDIPKEGEAVYFAFPSDKVIIYKK
jgi:ABC-type Fe3+/spermidine/putrescine transport system ATPase subunit